MKIESLILEGDEQDERHQSYVVPHAAGVNVGVVEFNALPADVIRRIDPKATIIDPGRLALAVTEFMQQKGRATPQTKKLIEAINERILDVCAEEMEMSPRKALKKIRANRALYPSGALLHADITMNNVDDFHVQGTYLSPVRAGFNSNASHGMSIHNGKPANAATLSKHEGVVGAVDASNGIEMFQRDIVDMVQMLLSDQIDPDIIRDVLYHRQSDASASISKKTRKMIWKLAKQEMDGAFHISPKRIRGMKKQGINVWKREVVENLSRANEKKSLRGLGYGALHPASDTPADRVEPFTFSIYDLEKRRKAPELMLWTPGLTPYEGDDQLLKAANDRRVNFNDIHRISPYRGGAALLVKFDRNRKFVLDEVRIPKEPTSIEMPEEASV